MLEQDATVVEIDDGIVWVESISRSSCSQCSSSSCATSVISKLFGLKRNLLRMENKLQAKVGDQVIIGIPDNVLVKASIWAYLVPVLSMLLVTLMAVMQGAGDAVQVLSALSGLALGFMLVGRMTRSTKNISSFDPQLLRIKGRSELSINLSRI